MQIIRHINHHMEDVISIIDLTPEEAGWVHHDKVPYNVEQYKRWIEFEATMSAAILSAL